ncbi:MAG: NADH-quinone oxidoreductase subunit L [candidate division NC10 bacterium]|nr:NADH-quinone oxidoreductase subunit L [candidate division NC10 bacterium]
MPEALWLIPACPLAGALLNGLLGRRFPRRLVGAVGCASVGAAFLAALAGLQALLALPPEARRLESALFPWITSGDLRASVGLLWDPLAAVMALVVSGVGFCIHVYSLGYMGDDRDYPRYFAFLNLFAFFMLVLVLADNYLLLFLGWEGVGLCSYLLIGFWFERERAAEAGKKAFLVNRVGDAGFLVGLFLLWTAFGTFDFGALFGRMAGTPAGDPVLTAVALLLFFGAAGKSAQLPLYVWLPDAMEGPTPVSALIHAATMVTAGVYMVARSSPLYDRTPEVLAIIAWVGALTAVFAATIACAQNDIKRVIAYSTISQLGYMFLGLGVGAYASGIFHLTTHAFFKALLFLAAGAVIHALHGEQDLTRMGGLRRPMRLTAAAFLVGAAANAGIFPLAGFWSKDEILAAAQHGGFTGPWLLGLGGAFLTAFYMFRCFALAFTGTFRGESGGLARVHDAPPSMAVPSLLLAALAVVGGGLGVPPERGLLHGFLAPVLPAPSGAPAAAPEGGVGTALLSVTLALAGAALAGLWYGRRPAIPAGLAARFPGLHRLVAGKFFVDEVYAAVIVRPLESLARWCYRVGDGVLVEGAVNGTAALVEWGSRALRRVQTGFVPNYVVSILLGTVLLLAYLAFGR